MSGIAGAAEYAVKASIEPSCAKCDRQYGDIGRNGKKLSCLPIMQAIAGIGVVPWCSRECRDEWIAVDGELFQKMAKAVHS